MLAADAVISASAASEASAVRAQDAAAKHSRRRRGRARTDLQRWCLRKKRVRSSLSDGREEPCEPPLKRFSSSTVPPPPLPASLAAYLLSFLPAEGLRPLRLAGSWLSQEVLAAVAGAEAAWRSEPWARHLPTSRPVGFLAAALPALRRWAVSSRRQPDKLGWKNLPPREFAAIREAYGNDEDVKAAVWENASRLPLWLARSLAEQNLLAARYEHPVGKDVSPIIHRFASSLPALATWIDCKYVIRHRIIRVNSVMREVDNFIKYVCKVEVKTRSGVMILSLVVKQKAGVCASLDDINELWGQLTVQFPGRRLFQDVFTLTSLVDSCETRSNGGLLDRISSLLVRDTLPRSVTLHVLWRLLCAPTAACLGVAGDVFGAMPSEEDLVDIEDSTFLRLRHMFDQVTADSGFLADHDTDGARLPVSTSPLDNADLQFRLSFGLPGLSEVAAE